MNEASNFCDGEVCQLPASQTLAAQPAASSAGAAGAAPASGGWLQKLTSALRGECCTYTGQVCLILCPAALPGTELSPLGFVLSVAAQGLLTDTLCTLCQFWTLQQHVIQSEQHAV